MDSILNSTGDMLGTVFSGFKRDDYWAETLYRLGHALGCFIHFMDAYDDLERDKRHGRFNLLYDWERRSDFEALALAALQTMAADAAEAFEELPIVGTEGSVLRNILYSGIWTRYAAIRQKRG